MTRIGRPQRPVHQLCLHLLLPITSITTKRPSAKEPMSCTKKVQPTEWSRKSGLAGRDITDIRAYELSHRGLGDFSFRLLSEGRHQSIVWARSGSESVLMTALLKKIRESNVSIDDAAKACHSGAPPDKHKEAMRFMEPLAQDLLKCVLAKAPVRSSDTSDELPKLKPNWLSTALLCLLSIANRSRILTLPTRMAKGQSPRCLLLIRMPRMLPRARPRSFSLILKENWILAPKGATCSSVQSCLTSHAMSEHGGLCQTWNQSTKNQHCGPKACCICCFSSIFKRACRRLMPKVSERSSGVFGFTR